MEMFIAVLILFTDTGASVNGTNIITAPNIEQCTKVLAEASKTLVNTPNSPYVGSNYECMYLNQTRIIEWEEKP
jgi:hypothetical protein